MPEVSAVPPRAGRVYAYAQSEASSSKFQLGFNRKRSMPVAEANEKDLLRPPQMPLNTASRSEASLDSIRPPPSKAALFAAYSDPHSALSTKSLPNHPDSRSRTSHDNDAHSRPSHADVSPSPKKGLFSWAHRERKKSKPSEAPPKLNVDLSSDSFNLKAFRHVGPAAPESPASTNTSPDLTLLPPARPRPRGDSFASDSSQRISVAAFREAAARKSTVNLDVAPSPVLLRPPSRTDSLQAASFRASTVSGTSPNRTPVNAPRASALIPSDDTSSEESEASESESDDSEGSSTMRPKRKRTIRAARKGTSEHGHRRVSPVAPRQPSKSVSGHGPESDSGRAWQQQPQVCTSSRFYQGGNSLSTPSLQLNAGSERPSPRASPRVSPSNANSPNGMLSLMTAPHTTDLSSSIREREASGPNQQQRFKL
jgi:serine/arginine repetitive matrix protein 2